MSNHQSRTTLRKARTILSVDNGRATEDPFRLSLLLRKTVEDDLKALDDADRAVDKERGGDATSSPKVRAAKNKLGELLREGYRAIAGVPSFQLDADTKRGVFEAYGWKGGQIGELDDTRVLEMADDAVEMADETPEEKPAWLYPPELVALLKAQLDIIDSFETEAGGGEAQSAVNKRKPILAKLQRTNARCRFFYFSASDEVDKTAELVKIGHQPRRPRQKRATAEPAKTTPVAPQ